MRDMSQANFSSCLDSRGNVLRATLFLALVLSAAALAACTPLGSPVASIADDYGLLRQTVQGQPFRHLLLSNSAVSPAANRLHVYIEGDGLPWATLRQVSVDPTPRDPLALRLMILDRQPAIYLGRPCYFDEAHDSLCSPLIWTHQRYSAEVVDSMVSALRGYVKALPQIKLTLIGYSGGGVLAMLMASRLSETEQVVTVAANLAVQQWTELHGFSPLEGSLDPEQEPALSVSIKQFHLVGDQDSNVPEWLIRRVADKQSTSSTQVIVKTGFDHRCCWVGVWPSILRDLNGVTENQ